MNNNPLVDFGFPLAANGYPFVEFEFPLAANGYPFVEFEFPLAANGYPFVESEFPLAANTKLRSNIVVDWPRKWERKANWGTWRDLTDNVNKTYAQAPLLVGTRYQSPLYSNRQGG